MEIRGTSCEAGRNQGMETGLNIKVQALDSENVKASVQGSSTGNGHTVNITGTITGKWIGASCPAEQIERAVSLRPAIPVVQTAGVKSGSVVAGELSIVNNRIEEVWPVIRPKNARPSGKPWHNTSDETPMAAPYCRFYTYDL